MSVHFDSGNTHLNPGNTHLNPGNTHLVIPIIQALISYLPDSITFINLSKTCKIIHRLCCNNVNQLKFKHGIQSKPDKHECTFYEFHANGKLMCQMRLNNMSKKKNGLCILYFHHEQIHGAKYNYRFDKLIGEQVDSDGRCWRVPKGKNSRAEPEWKLEWKLGDYKLEITPLSFPKKEDMDLIEKYHNSLLALLH
jgi:hypothetical protein